MILCSRCLDPTYEYGQRPFDLQARYAVGQVCEGCRAAVYEAWNKMTNRGPWEVYRWGPRPVMEVMADAIRTPV